MALSGGTVEAEIFIQYAQALDSHMHAAPTPVTFSAAFRMPAGGPSLR